MKGVILAGGKGTRLRPLTNITNKHLLPVYDKPMIEYPIATLTGAGVRDILIVSGREHAGHFVNYLGSGSERGLKFSYRVQEEARGIAEALGLAEDFVQGEKCIVILGDNIFEDNFSVAAQDFYEGSVNCVLFVKTVDDPSRFGVFDERNGVQSIVEKPAVPPSNLAIVGLYMYDQEAFLKIKELTPSERGELEITDLNNWYLENRKTLVHHLDGFWSDAGTFDSMLASTRWASKMSKK